MSKVVLKDQEYANFICPQCGNTKRIRSSEDSDRLNIRCPRCWAHMMRDKRK